MHSIFSVLLFCSVMRAVMGDELSKTQIENAIKIFDILCGRISYENGLLHPTHRYYAELSSRKKMTEDELYATSGVALYYFTTGPRKVATDSIPWTVETFLSFLKGYLSSEIQDHFDPEVQAMHVKYFAFLMFNLLDLSGNGYLSAEEIQKARKKFSLDPYEGSVGEGPEEKHEIEADALLRFYKHGYDVDPKEVGQVCGVKSTEQDEHENSVWSKVITRDQFVRRCYNSTRKGRDSLFMIGISSGWESIPLVDGVGGEGVTQKLDISAGPFPSSVVAERAKNIFNENPRDAFPQAIPQVPNVEPPKESPPPSVTASSTTVVNSENSGGTPSSSVGSVGPVKKENNKSEGTPATQPIPGLGPRVSGICHCKGIKADGTYGPGTH